MELDFKEENVISHSLWNSAYIPLFIWIFGTFNHLTTLIILFSFHIFVLIKAFSLENAVRCTLCLTSCIRLKFSFDSLSLYLNLLHRNYHKAGRKFWQAGKSWNIVLFISKDQMIDPGLSPIMREQVLRFWRVAGHYLPQHMALSRGMNVDSKF